MTRPTIAQLNLARSTLPVRRVASTPATPVKNQFSALLQNASSPASASSPSLPQRAASTLARPAALSLPGTGASYHAAMLPTATPTQAVATSSAPDAPRPMSRADIISQAKQFMGVPYVWGGNSSTGLDCSAFVSKAWGISRHTTDNLSSVARPIGKDELNSGDALNLTTSRDADGSGHVRLFDRWANAEKTKMYVYEETPPKSLYHVINWDPSYQPMRRLNVTD